MLYFFLFGFRSFNYKIIIILILEIKNLNYFKQRPCIYFQRVYNTGIYIERKDMIF